MIKFPHHIDHKNKEVFVYVESGFPTTIAVPKIINKTYPNYKTTFVSKDYIEKLKSN